MSNGYYQFLPEFFFETKTFYVFFLRFADRASQYIYLSN